MKNGFATDRTRILRRFASTLLTQVGVFKQISQLVLRIRHVEKFVVPVDKPYLSGTLESGLRLIAASLGLGEREGLFFKGLKLAFA